ncbi:MAG: hypothetical protein U7123_02660 [Potamolinea sp.]
MSKIGDFKAELLFYQFYFERFTKNSLSLINKTSIWKKLNTNPIVELLKKDSFALGITLPNNLVKEIREFAIKMPCYGNGITNLGFYYPDKTQAEKKHGKSFLSGKYYNTASFCPAIKKLESDPSLLAIAAEYLQAEPLHQGNQLSWTFPTESTIYERRRKTQMFYYNSDNCRLLKFSFYITDVDLCSSPDVCVKGSHIKKKLSHLLLRKRGCSYQEIVGFYGYKNIVPICGKAGLGFVKDTLCFHNGTPPSSKECLKLEIKFAAKDYGMPNDLREASQLECIL